MEPRRTTQLLRPADRFASWIVHVAPSTTASSESYFASVSAVNPDVVVVPDRRAQPQAQFLEGEQVGRGLKLEEGRAAGFEGADLVHQVGQTPFPSFPRSFP